MTDAKKAGVEWLQHYINDLLSVARLGAYHVEKLGNEESIEPNFYLKDQMIDAFLAGHRHALEWVLELAQSDECWINERPGHPLIKAAPFGDAIAKQLKDLK